MALREQTFFGVTDKVAESKTRTRWKTPEDVMEWWLKKATPTPDPDQGRMEIE